MTANEGVIKYTIVHKESALEQHISLSELNSWRTILFKLQLIGQHKDRYDGYGFGNISQRINSPNSKHLQFIISGTQTGGIASLSRKHYCHVLYADPIKNSLSSAGQTKPSSEALTHASVYQHDNHIQAVIHVHSPEIWNNTTQLKLAYTAENIAYGTPEMANEVAQLLQTAAQKDDEIFTMLGHKDGVIAFSDTIETAVLLLIKYYSKAIALEQNSQ